MLATPVSDDHMHVLQKVMVAVHAPNLVQVERDRDPDVDAGLCSGDQLG